MLLLSSQHVDCSVLIFPLSVWLTCKITLLCVQNSVTFTQADHYISPTFTGIWGIKYLTQVETQNCFVSAERSCHLYLEHYNSETQFIKIFSHYSSYHLSVTTAQNVRLKPRCDQMLVRVSMMCLDQGALSYWAPNRSEYDQDWDISED